MIALQIRSCTSAISMALPAARRGRRGSRPSEAFLRLSNGLLRLIRYSARKPEPFGRGKSAAPRIELTLHYSYITDLPGFAITRWHDESGAPVAGACDGSAVSTARARRVT